MQLNKPPNTVYILNRTFHHSHHHHKHSLLANNIGAISTYWVHIGQYYNIGPMLVRYCGANVTVSQYWRDTEKTINSGTILMPMI